VVRLWQGGDYEGDHADVYVDAEDPHWEHAIHPGDVACVLISRDEYRDCSLASTDYAAAAAAVAAMEG
jgi:hypothetical protein